MISKEVAFKKVLQVYVDDETITTALIEAGISAEDNFAQGDLKALELAAIPVLQSLMVVSSESEGGQSISYNLEGIKSRLLLLAKKHNLTELIKSLKNNASVRARRVW